MFLYVTAYAKGQSILVVGDSLSAGYGIARSDGWVALLQQRFADRQLDFNIVNASITGDTTHGGLTRLPAALQSHQPGIVIIELGGNDGLRGLSLRHTRDNLQQMIRLSREQGARVLLLGVRLPANYGRVYGEKFQQIYVDLAQDEKVAVVPFFLQGVAETLELMQADGIHPAAAGQPRILSNVWDGLEGLL